MLETKAKLLFPRDYSPGNHIPIVGTRIYKLPHSVVRVEDFTARAAHGHAAGVPDCLLTRTEKQVCFRKGRLDSSAACAFPRVRIKKHFS
jgi:hypothetical protein